MQNTPVSETGGSAPTTDGTGETDTLLPGEVGTSPSGLEEFGVPGSPGHKDSCERKHMWQKIAGLKRPQHASAALGDRIHEVAEGYLRTGVIDHSDPKVGAIVSSGTHLLPPVVHEIEERGKFRSPTIEGLIYRLRKDFVVHPFQWINGEWHAARPRPLVGDHKSTKSIADYAKRESELGEDVQAIVYAKSELDRWRAFGVDGIDGRWVYYETGQVRRAEKREFYLSAAEVDQKFSKIELTAARLASIVRTSRIEDDTDEKRRLRVLSLPYNANACTAFGGCPFQGQCNLSPAERLSAMFRQFNNAQGDQTPMQNAPNGFAQQFAGAPGPMPVAAAAVAPVPQPAAPAAPPGQMPTHAANGLPLPPTVVETGMVFDVGSNQYYDVRQIIASHGWPAISPLLDAAALRHQQTAGAAAPAPQSAPLPPAAPPPAPAAAPPPVPGFLASYAVNPPEGPAPQAAPVPAPQPTAPPAGADDENGADGLKGKAAIQAKIDAEVMAGTFKAAPPYARTGKGRRTNEEIEQDLRWQKTQALGLTGQHSPVAPAPSVPNAVPGPIVVAQADNRPSVAAGQQVVGSLDASAVADFNDAVMHLGLSMGAFARVVQKLGGAK